MKTLSLTAVKVEVSLKIMFSSYVIKIAHNKADTVVRSISTCYPVDLCREFLKCSSKKPVGLMSCNKPVVPTALLIQGNEVT